MLWWNMMLMLIRTVPDEMRQRIQRYMVHDFELHQGMEETTLLDNLPTRLRHEVGTADSSPHSLPAAVSLLCPPSLLSRLKPECSGRDGASGRCNSTSTESC